MTLDHKFLCILLVAWLLGSCSAWVTKDPAAGNLSKRSLQQTAVTIQTSEGEHRSTPTVSSPTASWTDTPTILPATPTDIPTSTPEWTFTSTPALALTPSQTVTPSNVVDWSEAGKYAGEERTVCGPVKGTHYAESSNGKPTFLNIGEDYPSPKRFTVLIWGDDRDNFPSEHELFYAEKNICANGEIQEYQGTFEIVVRSPEAITVQESSD